MAATLMENPDVFTDYLDKKGAYISLRIYRYIYTHTQGSRALCVCRRANENL